MSRHLLGREKTPVVSLGTRNPGVPRGPRGYFQNNGPSDHHKSSMGIVVFSKEPIHVKIGLSSPMLTSEINQ